MSSCHGWLDGSNLQGHRSFLSMRSQLITPLYFGKGNKPPVYLLLTLARWNENMLGIQDSVIRMAYTYFSSAKCSQEATKDKSESNTDPFKISTHTHLEGLGKQIIPLSIISSFPFLGALGLYMLESKLCWPLFRPLLTPVKFPQPCCYCHIVVRNPPALPIKMSKASIQLLQRRSVGIGGHKQRPWQQQ